VVGEGMIRSWLMMTTQPTKNMIQAHYKSKKALKESVGQSLQYNETSFFGDEYKSNGTFCVADYSPSRKWFAQVTMEDDKIKKVS